jgi:hypothetical protein
MQTLSSSTTLLEQAAVALGVRPLLWLELDVYIAAILRGRLHGRSYASIGEELNGLQELQGKAAWPPSMVEEYEQAGCHLVLKKQTTAVQLDRLGYGRRWSRR